MCKTMKYIKEYKEIDPFDEEDWDEIEPDNKNLFFDEETRLELEWSPIKKLMDGWMVRNIFSEEMKNFTMKYFDVEKINQLHLGYKVRLKIEEYEIKRINNNIIK